MYATIPAFGLSDHFDKCIFYYTKQSPRTSVPATSIFGLKESFRKPFLDSDPTFQLPLVDTNFRAFPLSRAVDASAPILVGRQGEGYYILRKIGKTWRSNGATDYFGVQSDPTWIISTLGPKLAAFFGFRIMEDNFMIAPNSALFNQRIRVINKFLKRKGYQEISARWADEISDVISRNSTQHEKWTYAESYIRRFFYDNTSPFQPKEIVHDIAHHATDILVTKEQEAPLRARIGIAIDFVDFLREFKFEDDILEFPILSNTKSREAVIGLFFQLLARDRDNFSGNIPIKALDNIYNKGLSNYHRNLDLFRIRYSHLGVAFSELHSPDFEVDFNSKYTVGHWLGKALFTHLFPLIRGVENEKKDDYVGLMLLRQYSDKEFNGEISRLRSRNLNRNLRTEMSKMFRLFEKLKKAEMNTVLAEYDSDLNVISGIASPEHPVRALNKRVFELNKALGF